MSNAAYLIRMSYRGSEKDVEPASRFPKSTNGLVVWETTLDLESLLCGDDPVHIVCVNCHADPPYLSLCGKDCTREAEVVSGEDISCLACSAVKAEALSRPGVKDLCEVGLCCGCGREA